MNRFQTQFDKHKAYFNTNITKSYEWRIEQLDRLARLLTENRESLRDAICRDFKTATEENLFEITAPLGIIEATKRQLSGWMKPVEAPLPIFLRESGHKGMIYREPYGVTLVIGPFNGPLCLLFDPAINVLAAGNPCILKVSEQIPETSELVVKLIPKYFDPGAVSTATGAKEENTELLELPFDFIFFTGSVPVGKVVMRAAAENLTPVLLELGGQNPVFVDSTANLKDAAKKIVWGKTAWGGQWCTSPGYALVHDSVVELFVKECKQALAELYGADPKNNSDYSRIISAAAVKRLVGLIDPAKVVVGGQSDEDRHYLAPTILYPVSWSDRVMESEIFGPILPIIAYSDLTETFEKVKSLPRPLSAFMFSQDQGAIDRFLAELSFGGGAVNQVNIHLFIGTMPFGGVGSSGIGNYYGKYGFDSLTHAKSILISPPDVAIEHLFPPYTSEKLKDFEQWHTF
jgi:aldehyde dehydrogenase (NAD+)